MRARLATHFPSIPALALYLATLLCELPVLFVRMLMTLAIAALVLLIKEGSPDGAEGLAELALIPTSWAIFALITPLGGGLWWRTNMGGRPPSERERVAYDEALLELREQAATPFQQPSRWFVLDTPEPDAALCGDTLALSRGLFETSYLQAVLAHELGHLNTSDGRLTAALNRLVINALPWQPEKEPRARRRLEIKADDRVQLTITVVGLFVWTVQKLASFAKGGFGLRLLAPFWGSYWREREYLADAFAGCLGEGDELADFLETYALAHDSPVPFIWLTEHTHPPTELRVDRLRRAADDEEEEQVAEGPEPVKAAPAGPPSAGPDGPALTEPGPTASRSLTAAGRALPRTSQRRW
jgi:Zn-dependent protease with chaperone function